MNYGCPYCDETQVGRCSHCTVVRFALPRTEEKDELMSPSQGEELCEQCGRRHAVGGVYYVLARNPEENRSVRDRRIDQIIAEDATRKS